MVNLSNRYENDPEAPPEIIVYMGTLFLVVLAACATVLVFAGTIAALIAMFLGR